MPAELLMTADQVAASPARWHERRRLTDDGRWCVTASEIPRVLGIAPKTWGGPFTLYHDKLSAGDASADTDYMRRGRALEPLLLEEFAEQFPGLVLLPGGLYASAADDRWLATLDGQAVERETAGRAGVGGSAWAGLRHVPDADVLTVQCKTSIPTDGWGWAEDSDQVPDHVRAQVLWEMHVRGAALACVACKFMQSWTTRYYWIELDDRARAEIAFMVAEAEAFCKRLTARDEPGVDWFPATTETLRRVFDGVEDRDARVPWRLALRYRAVLAAGRALERRRGAVVNDMLRRAGTAGTIVARDPATGRTIRVATRSAGPRAAYTVAARDRVHQMNACGWARQTGRWAGDGQS